MQSRLKAPLDAVVFDCDSTLSHLEGVDYLAQLNKVQDTVVELTADAMTKTGICPEIYEQRLNLIRPQQNQLQILADVYFEQVMPDVQQTISILQQLHKPVFIVSAGILQAVVGFANQLGIAADHVFAVNVFFDATGNYKDFDRQSPLINNNGKAVVVSDLLQKYARIGYVGDGLNDLCCQDLVTRFIGFGGAAYRQQIADRCEFYVKSASILDTLPLLLTESEAEPMVESI